MAFTEHKPIIVAMTGASGAVYGLRLLECLIKAQRPVYLMVSKAAQIVFATEMELAIPTQTEEMAAYFSEKYHAEPGQLQVFGHQQWMAPVASGSHTAQSMVICPCTTGTLSAVAHGHSDNLIDRAADVMLKERRKLIMVVRETPFSSIHLENMLKLTHAGAIIMPANPGFYNKPGGIDDLVDFMVARILDHLEIEHQLLPRWGS